MTELYREGIELNYNLLLLKHLDRISVTGSALFEEMGVVNNSAPRMYTVTNNQKFKALIWQTSILLAFIPDTLRDEEFHKEMNEYEEQANIEKEKLEKTQEGSVSVISRSHNLQKIHASINLLARKGMLFDKGGIAKFKPKDEVWE